MYFGYCRVPWWRWGLVLLVIPWFLLKDAWRDLFSRPEPSEEAPPEVGPLSHQSALFENIISLEQVLANGVFQGDRSALEELFHPEFSETDASGEKVGREEAIVWILARSESGFIEIQEPSIESLGEGRFLLRYKTVSKARDAVHRESLWLQDNQGALRISHHRRESPNRS
ncbi:MAG: nuclear transport factor 2 family protein [Fibrobacteres bacterium]|nr:nuclear transport factor 2 family protein [Fibrobacterota bacterium]